MTTARLVRWQLDGVTIEGDLYVAAEATPDRPHPCIVMAHGIGATRDSGLDGIARELCDSGFNVLTFDYRHFGTSGGEPRQLLDPGRQRRDIHSAVQYVRKLATVNDAKIVLWGDSYGAGHVLQAAREDSTIAAVVAMIPAVDGRAAILHALRTGGVRWLPTHVIPVVGAALSRSTNGRSVQLVGPPNSAALLTAADAQRRYTDLAGPTWRNEIRGWHLLTVWWHRPARAAVGLQCPVLMQIADQDSIAPPRAVEKAAVALRAEVRHYPVDHFDLISPGRWRHVAVSHQVAFLRRVMSAANAVSA